MTVKLKNLERKACPSATPSNKNSYMDWYGVKPSLRSDTNEQLAAWAMTQRNCNYGAAWDLRLSQQCCWGFRPSAMWRSLVRLVVPDLSKDQVDLTSTGQAALEDEGIMIPWSVRNHTTRTAAHPIQLVPLTMGQFIPYYHGCPPVQYTTNTTVFLTMHHHWTQFWHSLANSN